MRTTSPAAGKVLTRKSVKRIHPKAKDPEETPKAVKAVPRPKKALPASNNRIRILYAIVGLFILLYIGGKIAIDFSHSLFVTKRDRVNIVVYGPHTTFYSFGIRDVGNYAIAFYPDLKVQVPGGYGYYRVGALGKLTTLEKKPELLKRTFTAVTSTFVDYGFYKEDGEVFYGGEGELQTVGKPSNWDIFSMKSNAAFFDKVYLMSLMNQIQPNSVHDIDYLPFEKVKNDTIFNNNNFLEKYIGVFYQKAYRADNKNVQILYTKDKSYDAAEMVSSVLNGNGILVGDISQSKAANKRCTVIEDRPDDYTETAKTIASFFGCTLERGETDVYDILFVLGTLEETWEIQ